VDSTSLSSQTFANFQPIETQVVSKDIFTMSDNQDVQDTAMVRTAALAPFNKMLI
jgi:hypothetical protein